LSLDESLRSHLSGGYYEAGHMMYVHQPSLAKLKQDLSQFIQSSTEQKSGPQKGVAK
jgi:carboxypeptidase C (cathepsin A)